MNLAELYPVEMSSNPLATEGLPAQALSDVAARIGAEVAMPLTAALNRVEAMSSTGKIDRPGLSALYEEIDNARRAGMRGQQIARLASGTVMQTPERLNLAAMLREILADQAAQSTASGAVGSRQNLASAEVVADPSLIGTLLRAAADWSLEHARAPIDWRLELQPWPVQAKLVCQIAHRPADYIPDPASSTGSRGQLAALNSLDWLLLQFAAHMAGVQVQREDGPIRSTLTLRFPNTVNETLEGASAVDLSAGTRHARLVAGTQVLVLASRRDVRQQVRDAMRGHDLFVDYVPSVAQARDYCAEGAPQVLIYESAYVAEALRTLCQGLNQKSPGVALVEILPSGEMVEHGSIGTEPTIRVGADALQQQLAPLLVMALAQRG